MTLEFLIDLTPIGAALSTHCHRGFVCCSLLAASGLLHVWLTVVVGFMLRVQLITESEFELDLGEATVCAATLFDCLVLSLTAIVGWKEPILGNLRIRVRKSGASSTKSTSTLTSYWNDAARTVGFQAARTAQMPTTGTSTTMRCTTSG